MNCSNCGCVNKEGSKFCIKCGSSLVLISNPLENSNNLAPTLNQTVPQPQVATQFSSNLNTITSDNHQFNTPNNIEVEPSSSSDKKPRKLAKKTILIILAILIIGGAGIYVYSKFSGSPTKKSEVNLNSVFDPDKPIVIKNNNKYGYITSEGKTMIEPQYNSASEFKGEYAIVKIDNSDTTSYSKEIYQIIDKKGNPQLTSDNGIVAPEYHEDFDIWILDDVLYDSKLNQVTENEQKVDYMSNGYLSYANYEAGESGIMNYKGKIIFKWEGTSAHGEISKTKYDTDELFASVTSYLSPEKKVVISLKTGDILYTIENPEDCYISEKQDGIFNYYRSGESDNKTWLYFYNNKLAYETSDNIRQLEVYDYENQILEIDYGYKYEENGKSQRYYYYDVKNKKMLDEKPNLSLTEDDLDVDLTELTYGYKEYSCSSKYGLLSGEKIIIPCEYNDIEYLNANLFNYMKSKGKELVLLEKDKKTILMNLKSQKTITTFNSTYISDYDNSTFLKVTIYEEDGYEVSEYLIYNLISEKSITINKNDTVSIKSNYITIKKDGNITYYNTDLKQIYVTTE